MRDANATNSRGIVDHDAVLMRLVRRTLQEEQAAQAARPPVGRRTPPPRSAT